MQLNKLPFALCLAASLSACVVDDSNDTDIADTGTSNPTDPATTDPATTDPATTDPATTDPATTDPATTDPSSSSTDPATTDPGTESESETDVSTSSADSSGTGTDTGPIGACGWDDAGMFYACGGEGEDPKGNFPLECPEEPVQGAECDADSPINGIGCCFAGGNAFCTRGGTIEIDDSCAA